MLSATAASGTGHLGARPATASAPASSEIAAGSAGTDSEIERIKSSLEQKRKMFLVTALEGARLTRIEGNEFYIEFAPDAKHLRDTLAKSENVKLIRDACLEVTGKETGVRIAIRDDSVRDDLPLSQEEEERREKQTLRAAAAQDPRVQLALRKFRGEIVDVLRFD